MANLHQLLKAMVEKGASDLHITTGSPPQLRIDGKLVPLKTGADLIAAQPDLLVVTEVVGNLQRLEALLALVDVPRAPELLGAQRRHAEERHEDPFRASRVLVRKIIEGPLIPEVADE